MYSKKDNDGIGKKIHFLIYCNRKQHFNKQRVFENISLLLYQNQRTNQQQQLVLQGNLTTTNKHRDFPLVLFLCQLPKG
jgi:hypothetical protein